MVSLRKAAAYSKHYARPNTRTSKKRAKSFIKTSPPNKVVKYNMGKRDKYDKGDFEIVLRLNTAEDIQIRDTAIEASRQYITRRLDKELPGQFYFEIRLFPHHILRENKMLTGAGADRMQSGMKHAFGKMSGRAAMLKEGKEIFLIAVSGDKNMRIAKAALRAIKAKLPCKTKLEIEITPKIKA
jgi:large subunit ribosomal protein L10e